MSIHVLENHLFLLKGLKSSRPNIRLRKAKCFVSRGAQVINPTTLFPFGLNQPSFCQALQRSPCVTFGFLDQRGSGCGVDAPLDFELVENQEFV
jgi:hypothetical protein